jgi:lipoyl-dependent peroxiredoxin
MFPSIAGDPAGTTTPEELLAASHATCYGIGLRSLIARRGGRAQRVRVTATLTADKGPQGIRLQSSHLTAIVDGLEGIDKSQLQELARDTEERCTISVAIRGTVAVSSEVRLGSLDSAGASRDVDWCRLGFVRIKDLSAQRIISSQRREIDQMRALLEEGTRAR